MIKIRNLTKSFASKQILRGVNLDIPDGKTTVIFGLSGSGKSTIIKHIVGLLSPDKGEIFVDGTPVAYGNDAVLREIRKKVGFLFQSGALFDSMNVLDNVAFPLREHTSMSEEAIKKEVFEALDMVALDPNRVASLFPDELSGGMRKRVGLARTFITRPKAILYDEPTTGLDPVISDEISQLIIKLQRETHTTSILISHDIKEAFKCADFCAMLYDGKIVEAAAASEFRESKNEIVQDFLDGRSGGAIRLV